MASIIHPVTQDISIERFEVGRRRSLGSEQLQIGFIQAPFRAVLAGSVTTERVVELFPVRIKPPTKNSPEGVMLRYLLKPRHEQFADYRDIQANLHDDGAFYPLHRSALWFRRGYFVDPDSLGIEEEEILAALPEDAIQAHQAAESRSAYVPLPPELLNSNIDYHDPKIIDTSRACIRFASSE